MPNDIVDINALSELHALLGSSFNAVLREFEAQADTMTTALNALRATPDRPQRSPEQFDSIRPALHHFKGSALSLYCVALAAQCAQIEQLKGDEREFDQSIQQLLLCIRSSREFLLRFNQEKSPAGA